MCEPPRSQAATVYVHGRRLAIHARLRGAGQGQQTLLGCGTAPPNDDSTLQTEAVLIVVVGADRVGTAIPKTGVEVFSLDGAQGKFLIDFDIKAPTYRHAE